MKKKQSKRDLPANCPELFIQHCDCGSSECDSILIVLRNPVIRELKGPTAKSDELVSLVHFPMANIRSFIEELLKMAIERGFEV